MPPRKKTIKEIITGIPPADDAEQQSAEPKPKRVVSDKQKEHLRASRAKMIETNQKKKVAFSKVQRLNDFGWTIDEVITQLETPEPEQTSEQSPQHFCIEW